MDTNIKEQKIRKLQIFFTSGETVNSEKFIHKLFPKIKYSKIMDEAKKAGIMNAHSIIHMQPVRVAVKLLITAWKRTIAV